MAERLTKKINDKYVIDSFKTDFAVDLRKNCLHSLYGEPVNKLGKLEDILEKYGVDIQNLDYILEDYSKNQGRDFAICEEMDDLKKDRDTWKRACELACEREDDCYVYDNIHRAYEFYQQAKNKDLEEC